MIKPFEKDIPWYPGEPRDELQPNANTSVFNSPSVARSAELIAKYVSPLANSREKSVVLRDIKEFCDEDGRKNVFADVLRSLAEDVAIRGREVQDPVRRQYYQQLTAKVVGGLSRPSALTLPDLIDTEGRSKYLDISDIIQLHSEIFSWAREELGLSPMLEQPYLWFVSPDEIDQIDNDILSHTGFAPGVSNKKNMQTLLMEKERIGLTMLFSSQSSGLIFPGIVLSKNWPNIISNPDRVLLQENINYLLLRSASLYQMSSSMPFLSDHFGEFAFNFRNTLVMFIEQVGTDTTNRFSKRLGVEGKYLRRHEYSVDTSDRAIEIDSPEANRAQKEIKKDSPARVLNRLLDREIFNPAKQAEELFSALFEEIAQASPNTGSRIRNLKDQILRANQVFAQSGRPINIKNLKGDWITTRQ